MYEYKFQLERIIDGDTVDGSIDLGFGISVRKRIRLLGINAPETKLLSKIKNEADRYAERDAGLRAKDKLGELLTGKEVIIQTQLDKTGKFGRVLGTLITQDEGQNLNINEFLLSKGYVRKYKA